MLMKECNKDLNAIYIFTTARTKNRRLVAVRVRLGIKIHLQYATLQLALLGGSLLCSGYLPV